VRASQDLKRISTRFDDPNLVSHAGLLAPVSLAQALGLADLVDTHLAPPCVNRPFPPRNAAPVLASVKQTALDAGASRGRRERVGEWSEPVAAAGVESGSAVPGSDFSEASALGLEPVALESVAAPACPPGSAFVTDFDRR